MRKKLLATILFISFNSLLLARELTLEDAIDLAIENGREVKVAEKNLQISKYNMRSAFKLALPAVVYSGQYQMGESARNMGSNNSEISKTGYTQNIGIAQPIFQGGAIIGAIKGSKIYESNANLSYVASKRDIRLEVVNIYSSIIKNERDIQAFEASKKELLARYERQKTQFEMKLVVKTDLLKTEYAILDVDAKIDRAQNLIKIQKENLKLKLRIPVTEEVTLKEFTVMNNLTDEIDYRKDLDFARNDSIDALIAKNNVGLADVDKKIKVAEMLPKIDAFAKYGSFAEQKNYRETVDNAEFRGGVQVSWNVFHFGKDYDNYKAAATETEKQLINEDITKDNIELRLSAAYLDMINLEKIKASQFKAMMAAEENFAMDTERYDAGLIATIDYLASETQLREARVAYNQTLDEYYIAFEKYRSLLI